MAFQSLKPKFDDLFSKLYDKWDLEMVDTVLLDDGWLQTEYFRWVKITCCRTKCNPSWSPAVSEVIFYYRRHAAGGKVKLFLARPRCRKCGSVFEVSELDKLETKDALKKLLNDVKVDCYRSEDNYTAALDRTGKSYLVLVLFGIHLKISKILPCTILNTKSISNTA